VNQKKKNNNAKKKTKKQQKVSVWRKLRRVTFEISVCTQSFIIKQKSINEVRVNE